MPGRVVVQWDKEDCADMGMMKVDLLGLGMMAVLRKTSRSSIRRTEKARAVDDVEGRSPCRDHLAHLPPDDPVVYAVLPKPTRWASSRWRAARRWQGCRV